MEFCQNLATTRPVFSKSFFFESAFYPNEIKLKSEMISPIASCHAGQLSLRYQFRHFYLPREFTLGLRLHLSRCPPGIYATLHVFILHLALPLFAGLILLIQLVSYYF